MNVVMSMDLCLGNNCLLTCTCLYLFSGCWDIPVLYEWTVTRHLARGRDRSGWMMYTVPVTSLTLPTALSRAGPIITVDTMRMQALSVLVRKKEKIFVNTKN